MVLTPFLFFYLLKRLCVFKMTLSPTRIGTHDGAFHADEVLATAILTRIYPDHYIIRTRDPDIWPMIDILIDVGGVYDPSYNRYDHHMPEPPKNHLGHYYSSAGLIWKHYHQAYFKTIGIPSDFTFKDVTYDLYRPVEKHLRTHWIYPIDRVDNGTAQCPTPISDIIKAMRPIDAEKSRKRYDEAFLDTVSMVSHLFYRSCFHAVDHVIAKIKAMAGEKIYYNDCQIVCAEYPIPDPKNYSMTEAHFLIYPQDDYDGSERYMVIRPVQNPLTKEFKTPFSSAMLGLRQEAILKKIGIDGIVYCHHNGFSALAKDKESALTLCQYLLAIQQDSEFI